MKLQTYIYRINRLHSLIDNQKTGTPMELAKKLSLSESRVYCIVDDLRFLNVPIAYSRKRKTYYYTRPFIMEASLSLKELN